MSLENPTVFAFGYQPDFAVPMFTSILLRSQMYTITNFVSAYKIQCISECIFALSSSSLSHSKINLSY